MSLKQFIAVPAVREKLAALRPQLSYQLEPIKVPMGDRAQSARVGIAYDYLYRFLLERSLGLPKNYDWLATRAVEYIGENHVLKKDGGIKKNASKKYRDAHERYALAKRYYQAFYRTLTPTPLDLAHLAEASLILADLEAHRRIGCPLNTPKIIYPIAPETVKELQALIAITTFAAFADVQPGSVCLNPKFGAGSNLVSGADADVEIGDTLIEVKTVIADKVKPEYLDQLLGYFILRRFQHLVDDSVGPFQQVGLYLSRRAQYIFFPTSVWTNNPLFLDTERWFVANAYHGRVV